MDDGQFLVFMDVSIVVTAFPVLASISLAELKLLTTDERVLVTEMKN